MALNCYRYKIYSNHSGKKTLVGGMRDADLGYLFAQHISWEKQCRTWLSDFNNGITIKFTRGRKHES